MKGLLSTIAAVAVLLGVSGAIAQEPQFGAPSDVDVAKRLWNPLDAARLVGLTSVTATTYRGGTGLHTETLITLQAMVTVGGVRGIAVVKKNFVGADGEAATKVQVYNDPMKYLRV